MQNLWLNVSITRYLLRPELKMTTLLCPGKCIMWPLLAKAKLPFLRFLHLIFGSKTFLKLMRNPKTFKIRTMHNTQYTDDAFYFQYTDDAFYFQYTDDAFYFQVNKYKGV